MQPTAPKLHQQIFNLVVIVAALGYFVDIYDLILFSIVRVQSLKDLGLTDAQATGTGINLLNMQMFGMLLGGILWGILGDKKGRLSVLFITILLYSAANIANGMVQNIGQYYVLRFLAGVGLAGELGLGITLVSEVMSKEKRGYGTTMVSAIGIAGAVAGYFVAHYTNWRVAYYVGGGLGLLLLLLRVSIYESGMFARIKAGGPRKGDFLGMLRNRRQLGKLIQCVLIGIPVWFVIGIIITFSKEFASPKGLNIQGPVDNAMAVMYHYIGASVGALLTGLLSQRLRSRKKALLVALTGLCIGLAVFFLCRNVQVFTFYMVLLLLGIPNGYWSVFVTNAAEQFGTNLRATVATTTPNFVRGTTLLLTSAFAATKGSLGLLPSAILIGSVVMLTAILATLASEESFHKDLDYTE